MLMSGGALWLASQVGSGDGRESVRTGELVLNVRRNRIVRLKRSCHQVGTDFVGPNNREFTIQLVGRQRPAKSMYLLSFVQPMPLPEKMVARTKPIEPGLGFGNCRDELCSSTQPPKPAASVHLVSATALDDLKTSRYAPSLSAHDDEALISLFYRLSHGFCA